jgi:hypothetical protein
VAHHERVEQAVHLVGDGSALIFRNVCEGDGGHAAVAAMRSHLDLAIDPSFADRSARTAVKTRVAASQRSWGLNTLPTPVSGMGSIGMTCTGTAARSGVRSRTQASSSPGATVAPGFNCTYPTGNSPA